MSLDRRLNRLEQQLRGVPVRGQTPFSPEQHRRLLSVIEAARRRGVEIMRDDGKIDVTLLTDDELQTVEQVCRSWVRDDATR